MTQLPKASSALAIVASMVACGGASNTVKTQEDAAKILAAMAAATALVQSDGEQPCDGGGTVSAKITAGVDLLKGEVSSTSTFTFKNCSSLGVTINGSYDRTSKTTAAASELTNAGHIDTSLGSCIIDLHGTKLSEALNGTFCGFDYNNFQ